MSQRMTHILELCHRLPIAIKHLVRQALLVQVGQQAPALQPPVQRGHASHKGRGHAAEKLQPHTYAMSIARYSTQGRRSSTVGAPLVCIALQRYQ